MLNPEDVPEGFALVNVAEMEGYNHSVCDRLDAIEEQLTDAIVRLDRMEKADIAWLNQIGGFLKEMRDSLAPIGEMFRSETQGGGLNLGALLKSVFKS